LEGGGMRGVFTSGVLDGFMKNNVYFHYVVAVSAGACNGLSYMSHQIRRARISNIDFLAKYKYIGVRHLIAQGCIFDRKLLYEDFPQTLLPYDYDAYFNNPDEFEMVTTNCLTGRPCYLSEKHDEQRVVDICCASSSLPYVSKIVHVDGIPMLDGGIVDSIPVMHSIEKGHNTNVIIMTRNKGYRSTEKDRKIPHFIYKNYPRLRVVLSHRCEAYNQQLEMVEEMERRGDVVCIRPERPMEVGRMEKDVDKLERLYEEGYMLGEKFCREYMM
jgi:predicted patatin/cPLA2 family phospholipase